MADSARACIEMYCEVMCILCFGETSDIHAEANLSVIKIAPIIKSPVFTFSYVAFRLVQHIVDVIV